MTNHDKNGSSSLHHPPPPPQNEDNIKKGPEAGRQNGEETEKEHGQGQRSPPRIYFGKDGRPLFGYPGPPSAFAYAKPWPPTPTNLNKKQILRTDPDKMSEFLPCQNKNLFEPSPPRVSEIDLALKWDLAPYWSYRPLPKYVTCPVHGHIRTRSVGSASTVSDHNINDNHNNGNKDQQASSASAPPHRMIKSASMANEFLSHGDNNNNNYDVEGSSLKFERDRNRDKNLRSRHFPNHQTSVEQSTPEDQNRVKFNPVEMYPDGSIKERQMKGKTQLASDNGNGKKVEGKSESRPNKKKMVIHVVDEGTNTEPEQNPDVQQQQQVAGTKAGEAENKKYSKDGGKELASQEKRKEDEGKLQKCVVGPPPMLVSNNVNRASKCVGVTETDLVNVKGLLRGSTLLCPLHGSYRLGVERRNNPKFRTVVLMKDSGVQADLQIRQQPAHRCRQKHPRKPPIPKQERFYYGGIGGQPPVKKEVKRQTVTNRQLTSQAGHQGTCGPTRGGAKDGVISEYCENYKNPTIVAESKKRNRNVHTCALSNRTFNNHLR